MSRILILNVINVQIKKNYFLHGNVPLFVYGCTMKNIVKMRYLLFSAYFLDINPPTKINENNKLSETTTLKVIELMLQER